MHTHTRRERERERERRTRAREHTYTHIYIYIERERERHTHRDRERERDARTNKRTHTHTHTHTHAHTHTHTHTPWATSPPPIWPSVEMVAIFVTGSGISKIACDQFFLLYFWGYIMYTVAIFVAGSDIFKIACNPFFFGLFFSICARVFVICMCWMYKYLNTCLYVYLFFLLFCPFFKDLFHPIEGRLREFREQFWIFKGHCANALDIK